jgi:hypothetical protein
MLSLRLMQFIPARNDSHKHAEEINDTQQLELLLYTSMVARAYVLLLLAGVVECRDCLALLPAMAPEGPLAILGLVSLL